MATVRDTGFAEFAASLLGGVLDAVVNAQLDQARKMLQLRQAALLDDAAFAKAWVSMTSTKQRCGWTWPGPNATCCRGCWRKACRASWWTTAGSAPG